MPNSEGAGDACALRAALGALAKSISQLILPCGELFGSANFGAFLFSSFFRHSSLVLRHFAILIRVN